MEKFDVLNRWTGKVQFTAEIETTPDMARGWKLRLAVAWALANSMPVKSAMLDGADFTDYICPSGSRFDGSSFVDSSFDGSSFVGSSFVGSSFVGSSFVGSSFDDSSFDGSSFVGSSFDGSSFVGSSFVGSSFDGSSFVGSSFVGSSFDDSSFDGECDAKADFIEVISRARLEIPAMVKALREGRVNGSTYEGECACLVGTLENAGATGLPHDSERPIERWFMMISEGDKPGDSSPGGYAIGKALEWALEYCALTGILVEA
jgi:hypothetical protein